MESARIPAIYIVAGGIQEILYKKKAYMSQTKVCDIPFCITCIILFVL